MSKQKKFQDCESDRSRCWAFEVYPDSADPDWLSYLGESMIHAYVSPLHDKDIDQNGEPKKAHYHVMLIYETVQYPHQVFNDISIIAGNGVGGCNITDDFDNSELDAVKPITKNRLNWIGIDQNGKSFGAALKVRSKSGMARYLVHMDNADKYRYSEEDVLVFGVNDYLDVCGSAYDRYEVLKEMRIFCKENNIIYYQDLYDYAAEERPCDWFKVLSDSGTYVMDRYIKSIKYKMEHRINMIKNSSMEKDPD